MNAEKNRKVALVNPCATYAHELAQKCYPPMHLLYLAAALRDRGYEVDVVDANAARMSKEEVAAQIRQGQPSLVGVSLYSDILGHVRDLVRGIRQEVPEAKIVLGGPHVNAVPRQTLEQYGEVDFALTGEAERSLVALLEAVLADAPVDGIAGIVYRQDGKILEGPEPDFPELSQIPRPARELVDWAYQEKRYHSIMVRSKPVDTLFTSRGCPFHCGFCYNFRQKYRFRSADDVVDELASIRERGIRDVEICDDTFTGHRGRALEIFDKIITQRLDISFRIKSRVDVFNEDLAKKAKEAGVYLVAFGMESGSQRMLDAMNKKTTVAMNARACELTRKYRMLSHSSWIIGYPGETLESVEETVRFVRKNRPSTVNLAVLRPYPATEAYDIAASSGALVGDWHPDAEELPWVRLPWAQDRKILDDLCRKAKKQVYFTPYYVAAFGAQILKNANWSLARYAWQELGKTIRGR